MNYPGIHILQGVNVMVANNTELAIFELAEEKWDDITTPTTSTITTTSSVTIKPLSINVGDIKTVQVICSTNPQGFYIQVTDSSELLRLMDIIGTVYEAVERIKPQSLKNGSVCIARYAEDKLWYHAVVENVSTDNALVFFCDYGDKGNVPLTDIKEILSEHTSLPAQGIPCSLLGAKPLDVSWSACEIDCFICATEGKTLEAKFVSQNNGTFDVILKNAGSNANINLLFGATPEQLEAKAAIRERIPDEEPADLGPLPAETLKADITFVVEDHEELASLKQAKEERNDTTTTTTTTSSVTIKPLSINVGEIKSVKVIFENNPQDFYVQITDSSELVTLMNIIATAYEPLERVKPQCLKSGSICIARYAEDKMWYRAVVESVSTDEALVFFCDYGHKGNVPLTDIKEILSEHANLPAQGIPCSLFRAKPHNVSWSASEIDFFICTTEGKTLEAKFVSQNNVILEDTASNSNINLQFRATPEQLEPKAAIRERIPGVPRAFGVVCCDDHNASVTRVTI